MYMTGGPGFLTHMRHESVLAIAESEWRPQLDDSTPPHPNTLVLNGLMDMTFWVSLGFHVLVFFHILLGSLVWKTNYSSTFTYKFFEIWATIWSVLLFEMRAKLWDTSHPSEYCSYSLSWARSPFRLWQIPIFPWLWPCQFDSQLLN